MLKSLKRIFQESREKYRIPRSVRDLIPIDALWKDGIFKRANMYNKTYIFTDINYESASEENKEQMFLKYGMILNSFDNMAVTKITVNNRPITRKDFEEAVLAKMEGDKLDEYRQEYNTLLSELLMVDNGIVQEKYITVSVPKRDIKTARDYFARVDVELKNRFAELIRRFERENTNVLYFGEEIEYGTKIDRIREALKGYLAEAPAVTE